MRGALLLALVVALLASCNRSEPEQPGSEFAACLIGLRFETDEARHAFIRDNALLLAGQSSSLELIATTSPTDNRMALVSEGACASFDIAHTGLVGIGPAKTSEEDIDRRDAGDLVRAMIGDWPSWDHTTRWQCIARIAPSQGDTRLMNALMFGGLRTNTVLGAYDVLFAAYNEPCDLVAVYLAEAMSGGAQSWPAPTLCANTSLAQCGYPMDLESAPEAPHRGN